MHTGPMKETDGTCGSVTKTDRICKKCGSRNVYVQIWESNDGAYEDEKFTCGSCGHIYWVDGPDS